MVLVAIRKMGKARASWHALEISHGTRSITWQVVYQCPTTLRHARLRWHGRGFGSPYQGITAITVQVQALSEREDEPDQGVILRCLIQL